MNETQRAGYCAWAGRGDVLCAAPESMRQAWDDVLDEVLHAGNGDITLTQDRLQRRVDELGMSFRLAGEGDERQWPVSPVPLLIAEAEWAGIEDAVVQRAELAELIIADIYGEQSLVARGLLPAAALTGSPHYLRPMIGIAPPGGHYLSVYAVDLGRGPDGEWRVLADHTRSPAGAGYALENRLATAHVLGGLASKLNIARLATFFADLRAGLAAGARRSDPRIALLTPGRYNQSYAEQAHLARYLGILLVEGGDLAVHNDRVYVRTIEGLKRVDALWQRMDATLLDPLTLDARSAIGVAGIVDAIAAGDVVCANFPGSAILEAPLFSAFMPRLARELTGTALWIPNIATWWCGGTKQLAHVRDNIDRLVIGSAFGATPIGAEPGRDRAALLADMARRPIDYIGQEVVHLSTMPVADGGQLVPRPFSLRVFAARDGSGAWQVMPGGFARIGPVADVRATSIGAGTRSADVIVHRAHSSPAVSLIRSDGAVEIRRNPGTLPSRVADNLYWLGRYLERGEAVLALVRAGADAAQINQHAGGADPTAARIRTRLEADGAVPFDSALPYVEVLRSAVDDGGCAASVRSLLIASRGIGEGSRERLSADFWQLLDQPMPAAPHFDDRVIALRARFAAFAGLAAEHMGRTAGWRFHDLGRRIERAVSVARLTATFGDDAATAEDLTALLDICDAQITYRQRYSTGLALVAVRDLIALDPYNPRSIVYQVAAIRDHLAALPRLRDDGMAEPHETAAIAIAAMLATLSADRLNGWACVQIEQQLLALSDAISQRFFLSGAQALRSPGMTLA